jgi:hypothetical protein
MKHTRLAHIQRHRELHSALDELLADWAIETEVSGITNRTVLELMKWSHSQTVDPSDRNMVYHSEVKTIDG